jgi:hypothetical protein
VGRRHAARHVQERSPLSKQEIDTIAAWVDAVRRRATTRTCRRRRSSPKAGRSARPTPCSTMDEEFTIPATGTIPYKYFKAPTGLTRRQVDPGDRDSPERRAPRCITCWRTRSRRAPRRSRAASSVPTTSAA